jgi:NAD(P)-dependent dehydrogenase (short-subunit alcohol dehydrogenase family)
MRGSVLISGASRGTGLEFARQFARAGWRVFATCRSPERVPDLLRLAGEYAESVGLHPLDITDPRHIAATAAVFADSEPDLLIRDTTGFPLPPQVFGRVDVTAWLSALHVNVIAPVKLVEALADRLAASSRPVVAIIGRETGNTVDNTSGGDYACRSSDAALHAAVKSAALDLA